MCGELVLLLRAADDPSRVMYIAGVSLRLFTPPEVDGLT